MDGEPDRREMLHVRDQLTTGGMHRHRHQARERAGNQRASVHCIARHHCSPKMSQQCTCSDCRDRRHSRPRATMTNKSPGAVPKPKKTATGAAPREDLRVRRTKRALGVALVELMVAEEFDSITVQHVIEKAKVGRTTFYAHFRNTDDLLLSDAERFFGLLEQYFDEPGVAGRRVAPVAELLAHMRDVREFQRALERSGRREVLFDLMAGLLAKLIARRIAVLAPDASALSVPIPVASRMYAGALVELIRWSLDRDDTHSPAWVDARYHEVVWLGLNGAKP